MYTTTICTYIHTLCMSHIEYNILNCTRNTYPEAYIVFLKIIEITVLQHFVLTRPYTFAGSG